MPERSQTAMNFSRRDALKMAAVSGMLGFMGYVLTRERTDPLEEIPRCMKEGEEAARRALDILKQLEGRSTELDSRETALLKQELSAVVLYSARAREWTNRYFDALPHNADPDYSRRQRYADFCEVHRLSTPAESANTYGQKINAFDALSMTSAFEKHMRLTLNPSLDKEALIAINEGLYYLHSEALRVLSKIE